MPSESVGTIDDLMLRRAVMSASMAMAVTDPHRPDNPIVFTNPAFSELTLYAAERIVGRNCRFLQGRDTDPATVNAIRAALTARQDLQIDILNYRSDGSQFINRLFISPVMDGKGELVHYFASQLDATELVRADAIKRRREDVLRYLAGDLSHRLSSTMEVVQTLVGNALASASSVLEAGEAISARLVALGQVHRRISMRYWEGEDFEELVHQTIGPFKNRFAPLEIDGPRLQLGALLSLKLASVIYELSSSGSALGAARSVRVNWRVSLEPDGRRLDFTWHERGAAHLPTTERAKVRRALSTLMNDPRADISIGCDPGGYVVCRIAVPLPPG